MSLLPNTLYRTLEKESGNAFSHHFMLRPKDLTKVAQVSVMESSNTTINRYSLFVQTSGALEFLEA
ncbi:hypothetical protein QTP88_015148 [Uroleucon formosanum]